MYWLEQADRIICAIPRASLRSAVLICCAVSKAFMCRVSTQIAGSSAAINALTSHCDKRPGLDPDPAVGRAERAQKGEQACDIAFGNGFVPRTVASAPWTAAILKWLKPYTSTGFV